MEFTANWFDGYASIWSHILPSYSPKRYLEIGSFEGRSACHFISVTANLSPVEVCCIDTWEGGVEHQGLAMSAVEKRFDANLEEASSLARYPVALRKIKALSNRGLVMLLSEGKYNYFDVVYIDGSHQAPDVLSDAILAFMLVKVGGLVIFDDYLWGLGANSEPLMSPKLAIDSFINNYQRKIQPHYGMPLGQLYCQKIAE